MARFSLTAIVFATMYATAMAQVAADGADPVIADACQRDIKVVTQGDLDSIKQCTIFKGQITMDTISAATLNMAGIERLMGGLIMSNNVDMTSFSAPDLKQVDGTVKIINHTILSKVEFPKLTEAKEIYYAVLPALENINFPAGLTKVNSMRIEDTRAPNVEGFKPETIDSFTLLSNNYMKSFDFSSVKEVIGDILVLGNSHAMVFDAPNLGNIKTGSFLNLADVKMPALSQVKSDISFHENEFMALNMDKLENIGGTFSIANNNKLSEMSFKSLAMINGALSIGNNSQINTIEGFPVLSEIHGTVDLAGGFNDYKFPALQDVRGGMRLQTTSNKLACSDVERKLKGENIVKGNSWSCSANMQESNMVPTVGQSPNGAKGGSSSSKPGNGSASNNSLQATSSASVMQLSSSVFALAAVGLFYTFNL